MKIIIVGGGEKGLTLANLLQKDHEITLIENDEERAKLIASKTESLVIQGDGSDISILKEAGIGEADVIVATADDKTNLMVCQIAKNEEVKRIVSLINESKNEELFSKLEITNLVFVVGAIVSVLQRIIVQSGTEDVIGQLGLGDMQVVQVTVAEGSDLIDKKAEIKGAVILALYRDGKLYKDLGKMVFQKDDVLLVAVETKNLNQVTNLFVVK